MTYSAEILDMLTVEELRKIVRNLPLPPAPALAISGANKDQLIYWLESERSQLSDSKNFENSDSEGIPNITDEEITQSESKVIGWNR